MADTIVAPAAEPQQNGTAAAPVVPAEPVHGNPDADAQRRALYEKHYGANTPLPASTVQDPVTSTSSAAQAGTSTSAPASTVEVPEWAKALQNELARLGEAIRPAPAAAPVENAEPEPGWITLLREGKIKEAEEALADSVAKKVQSPMVDTAVARAREIARAESEITSFVTEMRTVNPELVPLERLIASEAQERLSAVQAAGKINSTDDAIREYKKAVIDATESVRKTYQTIRGAGKTEAQVRSREILASSTLSPQQVDTQRQQVGDQPQEAESAESYLEKRRNISAGLHNPYVRQ